MTKVRPLVLPACLLSTPPLGADFPIERTGMFDFRYLGGRTFVLTVGCGIVTSLMRWFDHLDNASYTMIITGSVCAYLAKTTIERHGEIKADKEKSIAETVATTAPTPLGER